MKILYVTNLINSGGVARVVMSYIEGAYSKCKEFRCDLVAYEKPNDSIEEKLNSLGVNYYCIPRPTRNLILYWKKLSQIIKIGNYDVIHTHIEYFN